jgi:hypothetical protein
MKELLPEPVTPMTARKITFFFKTILISRNPIVGKLFDVINLEFQFESYRLMWNGSGSGSHCSFKAGRQ